MRLLAILLASVFFIQAESFEPGQVKIAGALDYGQTSDPVEYTGKPRFMAFIFNGASGDKIEVTVKAEGRSAVIAIADGALKQLASGSGHLSFTLPNHGPDPEAYYLVFRDSQDQPARFTVQLEKVEHRSAEVYRGVKLAAE